MAGGGATGGAGSCLGGCLSLEILAPKLEWKGVTGLSSLHTGNSL